MVHRRRYNIGGAMKEQNAVVEAPSRLRIALKLGTDSAMNRATITMQLLNKHRFQWNSEQEKKQLQDFLPETLGSEMTTTKCKRVSSFSQSADTRWPQNMESTNGPRGQFSGNFKQILGLGPPWGQNSPAPTKILDPPLVCACAHSPTWMMLPTFDVLLSPSRFWFLLTAARACTQKKDLYNCF